MGADLGGVDAGVHGGLVQQLGEAAAGEAPALAAGGEEPGAVLRPLGEEGGPDRQIGLHRIAGGLVQGGQAFLAPLALDDQVGGIARQGGERQADQLGDAQTGGVDQLHHAGEPEALRPVLGGGRGDQTVHLGAGEDLGQRPALLRRIHAAGGIVGAPALAQDEAIELPHRGAAAGGGGGGEAPRADVGKIGLDGLGGGVGEISALTGQVALGVGQVLAVGGQGVAGRGALGGHHLQEGFDPAGRTHPGALI